MKKNIALTYNQAKRLENLVQGSFKTIYNLVYYSMHKINNETVFFIDDFFKDDKEIEALYRVYRQKIIPLYISSVKEGKVIKKNDCELPFFALRDKSFEYYGRVIESYQGDLALFMRPKKEYLHKKMPENNRFEFIVLDGKEEKKPYLIKNKYNSSPRIANSFDKIRLGINNK